MHLRIVQNVYLFLAMFPHMRSEVGVNRKNLLTVLTLKRNRRSKGESPPIRCYLEASVRKLLISMFVENVLLDIVVVNAADPALFFVFRVRLTVK